MSFVANFVDPDSDEVRDKVRDKVFRHPEKPVFRRENHGAATRFENMGNPVDDYGDDYGLREEESQSFTVVVAVVVIRSLIPRKTWAPRAEAILVWENRENRVDENGRRERITIREHPTRGPLSSPVIVNRSLIPRKT